MKSKNFDTNTLILDAERRFGERANGNLEDIIDSNNIHGWLQEKISSVEYRLAYVVTAILEKNILTMNDLIQIFKENAKECAKKVDLNDYTPNSIFNEIYNYLLAGMPCDRVNEVVENNDNFIKWLTLIDIHADYWNAVNGDVQNYNILESAWISSFIEVLNNNFVYTKTNNENTIERI